jgi:Bacterial Ig-like domain (group 2).
MPTRQLSNGHITVWWVTSIADPAAPTAAEINAGLNLSEAISWNNFELGSSGSADVDDRSIVDVGNAISRGFPDFAATLAFFREKNASDSASIYEQAFQLFKQPGLAGFLVVRYGQALPTAVAAADQIVSVYKFITDKPSDDTEGDDSVKFEVSFMPQGSLFEHTVVKSATAVIPTPTTLSPAVGDVDKITVKVGGQTVTASATYVSSDTAIAAVYSNGVVEAIAAGSATITITHPSATGDGTVTVTVT